MFLVCLEQAFILSMFIPVIFLGLYLVSAWLFKAVSIMARLAIRPGYKLGYILWL